MPDQEIVKRLDKLIELQELCNHMLYLALGGEAKPEKIKCPKCDNHITPSSLGYCPMCKADLKTLGVISDEREEL